MTRRGILLLLGAALLVPAGCGPPMRISTHGFRARVTVREAGTPRAFELALRGSDWRVDPEGREGPYTIHLGAERKAFRLDPAANTVADAPFLTLDELVPGHPLAAGFDEKAEAKRRGIESYAREGDEIFSGRACRLWRFADRPNDPLSETTTYWLAPDLERFPVRVDREKRRPDGRLEEIRSTQLTSILVGAREGLFDIPASWRRVGTTIPSSPP